MAERRIYTIRRERAVEGDRFIVEVEASHGIASFHLRQAPTPTLADARATVPQGFARQEREPADPPDVVERWVMPAAA